MSDSEKEIFWQYLSELNKYAFDALRQFQGPHVDEISRDIAIEKLRNCCESVGSLLGDTSSRQDP